MMIDPQYVVGFTGSVLMRSAQRRLFSTIN